MICTRRRRRRKGREREKNKKPEQGLRVVEVVGGWELREREREST